MNETPTNIEVRRCPLKHPHPHGDFIGAETGKPVDFEKAQHHPSELLALVEVSHRTGVAVGWNLGWIEGHRALQAEALSQLTPADKQLRDGLAQLAADRSEFEKEKKLWADRTFTINIPKVTKTVIINNSDGTKTTATIEPDLAGDAAGSKRDR